MSISLIKMPISLNHHHPINKEVKNSEFGFI